MEGLGLVLAKHIWSLLCNYSSVLRPGGLRVCLTDVEHIQRRKGSPPV